MTLQMRLIPISPPGGIVDSRRLFTALHSGIRDESAEGVRFMSVYPAKTSRRYRRTGTLRRSWSFDVKSGQRRIEGRVGSNAGIAPYNEDVQGVNQDALFAAIGWRNVNDLERKVNRDLPGRFERIIGAAT